MVHGAHQGWSYIQSERTQAHLVREDAIQAARVDGCQPVQSNVLVLPQAALEQKGHLSHALLYKDTERRHCSL